MQRQAARVRVRPDARVPEGPEDPGRSPPKDQLLEPTKPRLRGGAIRMPVYGVYLAASLVGIAGFILWGLAFNLGVSRGEQRAMYRLGVGDRAGEAMNGEPRPIGLGTNERRERDNAQAAARPPDVQPINGSRRDARQDPSGIPGVTGSSIVLDQEDLPPTAFVNGVPRWLTGEGPARNEPRRADHNYLKLESRVWGDEAEAIVAFTYEKEFPIVAVYVDTGRRGGNNLALYDLYALGLAVESSQFQATASERAGFRRRALSLGSSWRSQPRGTASFAQAFWEPFRGTE